MTDSTNTISTTSESFFQHVKDFFVDTEQEVVTGIQGLESTFEADVWPYVKTFLETLSTQVGQAALKAAVASVPTLVSGGFGAAAAAIGAAVVSTAAVDAPADAKVTLQQVQAALQVVKVANGTVTAGDAPTVAAIEAATPIATTTV